MQCCDKLIVNGTFIYLQSIEISVKLLEHISDVISTSTSPIHISMVWCLVTHRDNFTLLLQIGSNHV